MYTDHVTTLPDDGIESYNRETATVMTAMTFDTAGEPVDYFKQVFAAFDIANSLDIQGIETEVQLLVADDFVRLNQTAAQNGLTQQQISEASAHRQAVLRALAERYCAVPVQVASTETVRDATYDSIVDALGDLVEDDPLVRRMLLRSVPERHRDPERTARVNTRYTRRELATIFRSSATIKTGPARERLYDAAARDSTVRGVVDNPGPKLVGAYVSETLPTAVTDERLDSLRADGGILPYKAQASDITPAQNRLLVSDSKPQLETKLARAPPSLIADVEQLVRFMTDRQGGDVQALSAALADELSAIRSISDRNLAEHRRVPSASD